MLKKYNDVLLESMRIAIAEDLWNLIVLNREDKDYDLKALMAKKEEYKTYVTGQFLRNNSSPVLFELKYMQDDKIALNKSEDSDAEPSDNKSS